MSDIEIPCLRDEGKPWVFDDLAKAVRKLFKFAFDMKRKNVGKRIPYEGPTLTSYKLSNRALAKNLTKSTLSSHRENGRDVLDVIILIALTIGIEQGLRIAGDISVGDDETQKRAIDKVNAEAELTRIAIRQLGQRQS
jgi:hypothetical protein